MSNMLKLTDDQKDAIQSFLLQRFEHLREMRQQLDSEIQKEVDIYEDIDEDVDSKEEHEHKYTLPYIYTICQTMIARIIEAMFGHSNYLKMFIENKDFMDVEQSLTKFVQHEMDKLRLKKRSRDFLEEALKKRLTWLHLRPVGLTTDNQTKRLNIEFDVLDFYDVWFDTKAKSAHDTDYFVRKLKKLHEIKGKPDIYFNLDRVGRWDSEAGDADEVARKGDYTAKHSGRDSRPSYETQKGSANTTDEVEILEYYGLYDFSEMDIADADYKPDIKECIFTIANRTTLIRAELNNLPTKRKRLMFPIRPLRQSSSLIGKSVAQLCRSLMMETNEIRSLRMDNFDTLIKLLFTYDRTADIDEDELFAAGGNAIGYDGINNKKAVDILPVPNLLDAATGMAQSNLQDMQQITGAVDHVMGTSAARGSTETASGIRTITEQAMFKFTMMAENTYDDILDFINYVIILLIHYADDQVILDNPELVKFVESIPILDLEETMIYDIELKDMSQRRDVERNQWANMMGIIHPMVQQEGGNTGELLRQFFNIFQIPNGDKILEPTDPMGLAMKLAQDPQLMAGVMQSLQQLQAEQQQGGGGNQSSQAAGVKGGDTIERMGNENLAEA